MMTKKQARYILFFQDFYDKNGRYPKQQEIALAFTVSRTAVNQVIERLEMKGLIDKRRGKIVGISDIVLEACQKKLNVNT